MLLFFRFFVWTIFAGMIGYLVYFWRDEEKAEAKLSVVRKIWYVIYLLGAIIYWNYKPSSIFDSWKNYLVVAVVFFLIDALVFLGLYLRKIGGHELDRVAKSVAENQNLLQGTREKIKNVLYILNTEGITGYYGSRAQYLEGLNRLFQSYADKEQMTVSIFPFRTAAEKREALLSFNQNSFLLSKLERFETYYSEEDKVVFCPVTILGDSYVIKLSSSTLVSEVDSSIIGILLSVYDTVIQLLETGVEDSYE